MALKVVPRKTPDYYVKQPKSEVLAKLPGAHHIILGPSKSGKSVLWQSMILDGYKDCFSRIFIFTPSGLVDDSLKPIKEYITKKLGHNEKRKALSFLKTWTQTKSRRFSKSRRRSMTC